MLKVLLIFALSVIAGSVALAAVLGVPFNWIIGTVLLVEVVPIGTFGAAIALREMKRQPRQDWTHSGCDPVAPSLITRVTAEIVAPQQPRQLEAPRREMEVRK